MVPTFQVVRGESLNLRAAKRCDDRTHKDDGVWQSGIGPGVASRSRDSDEESTASQGFGDRDLVPGAIQDDVGADALAPRRLLIEVTDSAQVTLAFLSHISRKQNSTVQGQRRALFLRSSQCGGDCQQTSESGPVIARARSLEAMALPLGANFRPCREDSVNMGGEEQAWRAIGGADEIPERVAAGVNLHIL